jgi:glycosyltransferase involved in cell wall biosynthesis
MIIIVSTYAPPDHSGAGKRMYSFFQYLKEKGYEVRYITTTHLDEDKVVVISANPVEKYLGPLVGLSTFLFTFCQLVYRSLTGRFADTGSLCSVWLVSTNPLTAAAGVFFNFLGYRIITQNVLMHSDDPARRHSGLLNITHKLRKLQYYISDAVTSNSPGLYNLSKAYHPNCVMIPNPVEIQGIPKREKIGTNINILIVGRLSFRKGTDIAFRTIDKIHRSNPDIKFTFVGPHEDEWLVHIYDSCKYINRKNVHFADYQEDMHPWYTNADIFFLPSRNEGFPSAFIEAMAYGIPLVVKKLEGITDFIFDNGNPGVIDSEDPNEYANTISRLIDDKELYLSLVKKLRNDVSRFYKDNIYDQYIKLLETH